MRLTAKLADNVSPDNVQMSARDICLVIVVVTIWGVNFVVIKVGLDHFPPLLFSALRFLAAALPWAFFFGRGGLPWSVILITGLLLGVLKFSLLFVGIKAGLTAGVAALVLQSQILFTIVFSVVFFGERPAASKWGAVCLGLLGLAVISLDVAAPVSGVGFALVLGAGLSWALTNVVLRKYGSLDMFRLTLWMSLVPPIPLFVLSVLFEGDPRVHLTTLSLAGVGALFYTALLSTVLAYSIWGHLLSKYLFSVVVPYALLVPVIALAAGAWLLGEKLGALTILGATIAIGGLAAASLWKAPTKPSRAATTDETLFDK
jgi:O-acetylserine/cysteine efflux transporter